MKKRAFLQTTAAGAVTLLSASPHAQAGAAQPAGPALLTVTGAIGKANRGALDPALDQLMVKQKLSFDRAFAFDFAASTGCPGKPFHRSLNMLKKSTGCQARR